ncbi:MAG: Mur ligase family protein [Halofilum sp. (in: g-proteobacteria)]|nr:Mur ligase family protein [Halofilum sp. (in: g-proteobacteria)]
MSAGPGSAESARAAGWDWLGSLPRATVAHAERGAAPLAAVEGLLRALGDPHERLRVIHVAGSKGKGSTALYLEALLRASGRRTLTFTSPHLERWTERLRIDASEAEPAAALAALQEVQRAQRATGITPGFFEALTVAALWLAADSGVDWIVLEAGVGGRADATNVVRPRAAVITGIELEHTERLGDTLEAIAREKAGIVKPGTPLLAPQLAPPLDRILAAAAAAAGSDFVRLRPGRGRIRASGDPGTVRWRQEAGTLAVGGPDWSLRIPFAAAGPMAANAALALAVVARLGLVSREALQGSARVLTELRLPGRLEILSTLPWVLVDGAHTRASAELLAAEVRRLRPTRVHLLLSLSGGRDAAAVLGPLLPLADAITITCADPEHSLAAPELAAAVRDCRPAAAARVEPKVDTALARACADHPGETLVVATGSVYLAGRVRAAFRSRSGAPSFRGNYRSHREKPEFD